MGFLAALLLFLALNLEIQPSFALSMTPRERRQPDVINASRKKRIAAGSGTSVQEINRLLNQFRDMQKMMRQLQAMQSGKMKMPRGMGKMGRMMGGMGGR